MRIVQISDCHLMSDPEGELKGIRLLPRLKRVLEAVRRQEPRAGRLIVTGDLTHDEKRETYQALKGMLGEWDGMLRVIPGNHDDRTLMREVFGAERFELSERNVFVDQVRTECSEGDGASDSDPVEWWLIGLDTHVPGAVHGEVGESQVGWLQEKLSEDQARLVCLFLHHPPVSMGSVWLDRIGLLDRAKLMEVVQQAGNVRLVVSGHVHQERVTMVRGIPVFSSPSTAVQFRPETEVLEVDEVMPGYRVIELLSGGEFRTWVRRVKIE